jgi:hypothetical protein
VLRRAEMNPKDGERAVKAEPKLQCCRHRRTARERALQTNSASAAQLKIRPATATALWRCRGRGSRRRFSRTLPARPQIGVHPHLRQTLPHRAGGKRRPARLIRPASARSPQMPGSSDKAASRSSGPAAAHSGLPISAGRGARRQVS